jgi:hypothetical protein
MRQPLPTFGSVFADREAIAQMLSLDLALLETAHTEQSLVIALPLKITPCRAITRSRWSIEQISAPGHRSCGEYAIGQVAYF